MAFSPAVSHATPTALPGRAITRGLLATLVEYFTWTDLTPGKMIAENNGVTKTAGSATWDAAGRSTETVTGNGGMIIPYKPAYTPLKITFGLFDSSVAMGNYYHEGNQFLVYFSGTSLEVQYGSSVRGTQATGLVEDDEIGVRRQSDAVEVTVNGSVVYTFAESPHTSMAARISITPLIAVPNIEKTGVWSS